MKHNLELVAGLEQMSREKNCKPAQLALAWVLSQGDDIVPIPGTKRQQYLDETFSPGVAAGERYYEAAMQAIDR